MSLSENVVNAVNLTSRDVVLLEALSRCDGLTTSQAREVVFPDAYWYAYKRLKTLERRGLIRRRGRYLQITPRGLEALGITDAAPRPARLSRSAETGEICAALSKSNWEWLSSKVAKKEYNLNRGDRFTGVIRSRDGRGVYLVYILTRDPRTDTVHRIRTEIERLSLLSFDGAIILCSTTSAVSSFGSAPILGIRRLMVLPLPFGFSVINRFSRPEGFAPFYQATLPDHPILPAGKLFAEYLTKIGASECYICEMLTNDLNVRHLLSVYIAKQYRLEKRKVFLFCFESQLPLVSALFGSTSCIAVYAVSDNWSEVKPVKKLPLPYAGSEKIRHDAVQTCFQW